MDDEEERRESPELRETEGPYITFSSKATMLNIIISIVGNVVYCLSMTTIAGWDATSWQGIPIYLNLFFAPSYLIVVPIFGLLFTLLSLPFISKNPRFISIAKYSLANLIFNTVAYTVLFVYQLGRPFSYHAIDFIPFPIISLLLTLLLVFLTQCCNVSFPNCCSNFFKLPKVEYGALVPLDPLSHYVLNAESKPEHVLELEEAELEVIQGNGMKSIAW